MMFYRYMVETLADDSEKTDFIDRWNYDNSIANGVEECLEISLKENGHVIAHNIKFVHPSFVDKLDDYLLDEIGHYSRTNIYDLLRVFVKKQSAEPSDTTCDLESCLILNSVNRCVFSMARICQYTQDDGQYHAKEQFISVMERIIDLFINSFPEHFQQQFRFVMPNRFTLGEILFPTLLVHPRLLAKLYNQRIYGEYEGSHCLLFSAAMPCDITLFRNVYNYFATGIEEYEILRVLSRVIDAGNYQFLAKMMIDVPLNIRYKQLVPGDRQEVIDRVFKIYFQLRLKEKDENLQDCKQFADLFLNIIPSEHQSQILYYSSSLDDVQFDQLWNQFMIGWRLVWLFESRTTSLEYDSQFFANLERIFDKLKSMQLKCFGKIETRISPPPLARRYVGMLKHCLEKYYYQPFSQEHSIVDHYSKLQVESFLKYIYIPR
ncbi:hypothetical protein DFA_10457 [Cavenderia fasciculata]|uniref:Uncharacterized protein n=1 Tax=Cavenderia fasciculata TaxID=261658 RepID=F4QA96_CACFS|nr:uncharacterized protein DFA_10457 [Cavenderia fasciculata]EGG15615.1 hypothetical protein DFA_10457 [Cavenderia fasciculata]|eukprot:XP_004354357.1 hypothetical protein DFA_10457 [Cavenderia fasciculata]